MTDREREVEEFLNKKRDRNTWIDLFRVLFKFLTLIGIAVCGIHVFIYRMQNPHMTETQIMLFVLSKYWWLCIMAFASALTR